MGDEMTDDADAEKDSTTSGAASIAVGSVIEADVRPSPRRLLLLLHQNSGACSVRDLAPLIHVTVGHARR